MLTISSCASSKTLRFSKVGRGGNSSEPIPIILKSEPPEVILAWLLLLVSRKTSLTGNSLTMVASLRTGKVMLPVSETSALIRQRMPRSRLVVVNDMCSSSASISTLLRIGMVERDATTLRTCWRPLLKWSWLILNFMLWIFAFFGLTSNAYIRVLF